MANNNFKDDKMKVGQLVEPEIGVPKGFYYDIQTKDPTTRISLHPNTILTGYTNDLYDVDDKSIGEVVYNSGTNLIPIWKELLPGKPLDLVSTKRFGRDRDTEGRRINPEPVKLKTFHAEDPINLPNVYEEDLRGEWKGKRARTADEKKLDALDLPKKYYYSKEPICSAILNEDFKINISNNFSKLGGDPLGDIINQNKTALPYMGMVSSFLSKLATKTLGGTENGKKVDGKLQQWEKEGRNTTFIKGLGNILQAGATWSGISQALMNRAIVFQGARFSFYQGTGISYDNIALNYTIFPYWDTEDTDKLGYPVFKTVYDQLEILLPYVIGDFVPLLFSEVRTDGDDSKALTFIKKVQGEVQSIISSFGSWQLPPGGFEAYLRDIDVVQKGTLKLKIGSMYSIDNMVITSCNFSLSKHLIKHPQMRDLGDPLKNSAQYLTPAFCDVQLSLKPISLSSKNSLLRFMRGEGVATDKRDVYRGLEQRLKDIEDNLNKSFGNIGESLVGREVEQSLKE